jgi:hypothetical protein
VVVTPGTGGGIDTIEAPMKRQGSAMGLRGWLVWHYDMICRRLDDAADIRATYGHLITPGDVLTHGQADLWGATSEMRL